MNIAFSLTTPQIEAETKTVTRRLGLWWAQKLRTGDVLWAIEKGQGLKKGEHVRRLKQIRVAKVSTERLSSITRRLDGDAECRREGFPTMTPEQFYWFFRQANGVRRGDPMVTRIEFEYVKGDTL